MYYCEKVIRLALDRSSLGVIAPEGWDSSLLRQRERERERGPE